MFIRAIALLSAVFYTTSVFALNLEPTTIKPTLNDNLISYSHASGRNSFNLYLYLDTEAYLSSSLRYTSLGYTINLNKDRLSLSSSVLWSEVDETAKDEKGVVVITLPGKIQKYFQYTYTKPTGYSESSIRIDGSLTSSDVTDVVFRNISADSKGGAIYNDEAGTSINIHSDFEKNYLTSDSASTYGGAIYNKKDIGDISGVFIENYAHNSSKGAYGGAIYNYSKSTIKNIDGDFIKNYVHSENSSAYSGALYNGGSIGNITANFISNYVSGYSTAYGGAVYNYTSSSIDDIVGSFISNYAVSSNSNAYGGGINNNATIGNITGNFIDNHAKSDSKASKGGAIYNDKNGIIGNLEGDFIGNYSSAEAASYGGAVYNDGSINDITGNFIGNYSISASSGNTYGGAIRNTGTIGDIEGNFINNYLKASNIAEGGAIYNEETIGHLSGDFSGNHIESVVASAHGGAIYNNNKIENVIGNFIYNRVRASSTAYGGAVYNNSNGVIGYIIGDFINNEVDSSLSSAKGGALYNKGDIKYVMGSFIDNSTRSRTDEKYARGGAIYIDNSDMIFMSGSEVRYISGNYVYDNIQGHKNNAIFINNTSTSSTPLLTFKTTNGGAWIIDDSIEGGKDTDTSIVYKYKYDISFLGDDTVDTELGTTTQYVNINNAIVNAENISVENTTLKLGKDGRFVASLNKDGTDNLETSPVTSLNLNNAVFDISNDGIETIKLMGYSAKGNSFLHIDVDPYTLTADMLEVYGNVNETTKLIVHMLQDTDIRGAGSIVFAKSYADTVGKEKSFEILRVYGSPYLFDIVYSWKENTSVENARDNVWSLVMNDDKNPNTELKPEENVSNKLETLDPVLNELKKGNLVIDNITNTDMLPDSILSYKENSSDDYNFIASNIGYDGNEVSKYYKIELKSEKFSTSDSLKFKRDNNGSIEIKLPNNEIQKFSYEYTGDNDYIGKFKETDWDLGGAIYNTSDMEDITADFVENYLSVDSFGYGGAIYNSGNAKDISGNFIGNYIGASYISDAAGSAIFNSGSINDITGHFIGNYSTSDSAWGGAILNSGEIKSITGDFVGNNMGGDIWGYGGAIYNEGTIGDIVGDFVGNYAYGYEFSEGGAIYSVGEIGNIVGNFIGNYIDRGVFSYGGAISLSFEAPGSVKSITGNFIGNYVVGGENSGGGAIYNNNSIIGNITGDFINNYVDDYSYSNGGAILNYEVIGNITGNFIGNHVIGYGRGGAIYNSGTIGVISGSFINNYVKPASERDAVFGGAIYLAGRELSFIADNTTNFFSGNYTEDSRGKINNAIWVQTDDNTLMQYGRATLNFEIRNGGAFIFDDEIDGGKGSERDGYGYNLNISGDVCPNCEVNTIRFNDLVNNVHDLTLDTTQMALGKSAVINITHNYIAKNNPYLRLDLDAVNREVGEINVSGDIEGTTSVIVNVLKNKETAKENSIPFAIAPNHTLSEEDAKKSFEVYRVIGSPYMWEVSYNDTNKEWGLYSTAEENTYTEDCNSVPEKPESGSDVPTPKPQYLGPIKVAPEVVATVAVKTAGLSQTNGMVYNIMRKVGVNRLYCPGCGFYDYNWDGEAFHNAWVDTTYNGLTIEAPVEIDANVWGIEAGSDLQHDLNNKLGIFASYRQGNYEMNGKGEKYYSTIGSEIDIDSYLAGLYYRYDHNNWYAFATVYGGMQEAEIKTDDGVSADTDGIEFGGSIEGGYNYALTRSLSVTPSLGVFYSQINYDDATDSAGKTVEYNDLKQVELEAGAKFAYTQYTDDGFYSLYVKPSVVQTLVDGDEIDVTELGEVDTVEDKTLGRVEIGGNYGFNDNWSAYGWANYTFGSDYEATSLGIGLNYAW